MSEPTRASRKLLDFASHLEELKHIWTRVDVEPVWWDGCTNTFVKKGSSRTRKLIFPYGRMKKVILSPLNLGSVIPKGPYDLGLALPGDAVVIKPGARRTPVIASAGDDIVLKIARAGSSTARKLKEEIETLEILKSEGLDGNAQEILASGKTEGGAVWMATRLAPKSQPFVHSPITGIPFGWHEWLKSEGFGFLLKYYSKSGIVRLDFDQMLNTIVERADSRVEVALVSALNELASRTGRADNVIMARIHGDLSTPHVHRHRGEWRIIDWGESEVRHVVYEFLRRYWSGVNGTDMVDCFWMWLMSGWQMDRMPKMLRMDLDLAQHLMGLLHGYEIDRDQLRALVLLAMLDELVVQQRYGASFRDNKLNHMASFMGRT